jgi:hypothetical protein
MNIKIFYRIYFTFFVFASLQAVSQSSWTSAFVYPQKDGVLTYVPDEKGNIIPDFSMVGYYNGTRSLPVVPVAITLDASAHNSQEIIQQAINELSKKPMDANGFRGAILLKKGVYRIPGSIHINASGIVLRGEGKETKMIAAGKGQRNLIVVSGDGNISELQGSRKKIVDDYVPVGARTLQLNNVSGLRKGDKIILYRKAFPSWIASIKMNEIHQRDSTVMQWTPQDYSFSFEREIVSIIGNRIKLNAPVVMEMNNTDALGEIYKYSFEGRINHCAVENISFDSEYASETDEDHGWNALYFDKIENGWIQDINAEHFGYSCVTLGGMAKNITVANCENSAPVSKIIGGRRYSFNNNGQLNLFMHCTATDGRHDYVTGSRVAGPNVFYNCTAINAHADIGPHHRWAMGTLYDNISTDGEINIQDRGDWGTGHGWAGVNQVLWNCTVKRAAVQNPWESGKNYAIGIKGEKYTGRLKGRPDGVWEGLNKAGLTPSSLYLAQLKDVGKKLQVAEKNIKQHSKYYDTVAATLQKDILENALWAMQQPIETITGFHAERSAGGTHDFYSEGDYWWPDPKNPDSPYIQKDGMTNPANFTAHREAMIQFSRVCGALASAYKSTGNEAYAQRILNHCRAWFIDTATMMNPSLLFAQAIKGRATGRGIGIIDTIHLMEVIKALEAIQSSAVADENIYASIRQWFKNYLHWLTTHKYGLEEINAKNNHGTCWVMQVAVFAKFVNDQSLLAFCSKRFKDVLLPQQLASNGSFPLELKRTKPYGYSLFNLDAMATICQELSTSENNLWSYALSDGRSMRKALEFMYPFIQNKNNWPFEQDVMYWNEWPVAQPALLFAALKFDQQAWLHTWQSLPHTPGNQEVIRNLPVRNPLLWIN